MGHGRRAGGDLPALGPHRGQARPHVGRGGRRGPAQAQLLANRTGRRNSGRRDGATRRSRSSGCRSCRAAASSTRRSTRSSAARCSSAMPWWRATGTPTTSSSHRNQAGCSRTSRNSRPACAAATCAWTTRRSSSSTTRASAPRWSPNGTSTSGGRPPGTRTPTLLDFDPEAMLPTTPRSWTRPPSRSTWRHGDSGPAAGLRVQSRRPAPGNPTASRCSVPVLFLNQLDPVRFRWLIPGLRVELVTALIKSLPKADPEELRSGPRRGPRRRGRAGRRTSTRRPTTWPPPWSWRCAGSRAWSSRPVPGTGTPCRRTCASPSPWSTPTPRSWTSPRTWRVLQQSLAAANRSALARSLGIKPGAALPAGNPGRQGSAVHGQERQGRQCLAPAAAASAARQGQRGGHHRVGTHGPHRLGRAAWPGREHHRKGRHRGRRPAGHRLPGAAGRAGPACA